MRAFKPVWMFLAAFMLVVGPTHAQEKSPGPPTGSVSIRQPKPPSSAPARSAVERWPSVGALTASRSVDSAPAGLVRRS